MISPNLSFCNPQIVKYLIVGSSSAVAQFASLALLVEILRVPNLYGISIAYFLSVLVHFFGNKHYTFRDNTKIKIPQICKYLLVVAANYAITVCVASFALRVLQTNAYIATAMSIGATTCSGYLLSRNLVFKG